MIIDCHVHPEGRDAAGMLRHADRHGIDRMCLFALGNEIDAENRVRPFAERTWPQFGAQGGGEEIGPAADRMAACNGLVARMVESAPDRLHALCHVNPRHGQRALDEIRNRVENGPMLGVKLWISCRANDPLVEPVAALALELGVPILQHCWNKFGGNTPGESTTRDVAELAAKFPDLSIVAAHLPGHHEEGILDLAPHPNVALDTSGMAPDAGILEFARDVVGARRILFGSDFPIRHPGSARMRVEACDLTSGERKAIFAENFQRIFLS